MLDRPVRTQIDPWLELPAKFLAGRGISANQVSVAGFALGMAGCVAISREWYTLGLVLMLFNRLADGLDGMVARRSAATDVGGFLDIVLDILFYGAVPLSFALADHDRLLPALFLVHSFMGTVGSFLAFAVIEEKRNRIDTTRERKSFYYSRGLMEGTETIIAFSLFCVLPEQFNLLAWTFGSLCWLTTLIRVVQGCVAFRGPSDGEP